jgi:hypothetical protein
MGCCNNPQKDEKDELAIDFDVVDKNEPKLDLSDNNNNLLDDGVQLKTSQVTTVDRKKK